MTHNNILTLATTVWIASAAQLCPRQEGAMYLGRNGGTHHAPAGREMTSHFLQLSLHAPSTSLGSFEESDNKLGIHIPDTAEHITSAGRKFPLSLGFG